MGIFCVASHRHLSPAVKVAIVEVQKIRVSHHPEEENHNMERTYLTIDEAAAHLNYSRTTLRKLIREGRIAVYRAVKDAPRLLQSDLDAFMASGREVGASQGD